MHILPIDVRKVPLQTMWATSVGLRGKYLASSMSGWPRQNRNQGFLNLTQHTELSTREAGLQPAAVARKISKIQTELNHPAGHETHHPREQTPHPPNPGGIRRPRQLTQRFHGNNHMRYHTGIPPTHPEYTSRST